MERKKNGILSESANPRNYWKVLKSRLNEEGSEVVTKCNQFKFVAEDGNMRVTDAADVETIFRLVQSVPSPKAEPFKLWLAKVGYERMQETVDPELAVNRGRKNLKKLKSQNLRDHMSEAEIIFTALAELSTRQISEKEKSEGYGQNESVARKGGRISGNARKALEDQTGKKIVNSENFLPVKKQLKKLK